MNEMFCYQCEQTAGGKGCSGACGVCGKTAGTAQLQDDLVSALISYAQAAGGKSPSREAARLVMECLFSTLTNVSFDDARLTAQIEAVEGETRRLLEENPAAPPAPYPMERLWGEQEDVRSLKSLLLFGLKGIAAYAYHGDVLGYRDETVDNFLFEGLCAIAGEAGAEELLDLLRKAGTVNYTCMALLDQANTETFGTPAPTKVTLKIEKGPFIVISGHDLRDVELLLQQTQGKGVNVYTHGELLPAHAYPQLKKYPYLKGNFGTAWHNQQEEFDGIPAPIVFTTNCLMPPKESYRDRVYTTEVVAYPELTHIGEDKDFTPVIQKALQLGGYPEDRQMTGINGGRSVTTGFGHGALSGAMEPLTAAIRAGQVKHIYLVGGCDGPRKGRSYYTDFVKQTPEDSIVLTLACGKYRFNDLDLGEVAGLPRLIDIGQCNDAYSAIQVAVSLAEAFSCGVNDLPLTIVLSWFEQKAVAVLLTLLSLGVKNIQLGPTLPAFVSPGVLKVLLS